MSATLPYPDSPQNGDALDANPIYQNFTALIEAIQSFDASQIEAGTLLAAAFNANINPNTLLNETTSPFVRTGCVWSTISGLNAGMTSGVIYYNGIRVPVNSVSTQVFTASKDTYIDIDVNGNITYQAVTNGASAPSLTANSIRVAKVVTSGSAVTTVVQFGADSLGNIIYPTGANSTAKLQNPYKFSVYLNSATNTVNGNQKIPFDTKVFDTGVNFDVVTNNRFVAPIAGYYQVNWNVEAGGSTTGFWFSSIYKNGSKLHDGSFGGASTSSASSHGSALVQLAATDYLEIFINTGAITAISNSEIGTNFSGFLVSGT